MVDRRSTEVDAYARDVVDGRIPAGKYHRLACARHLKDRTREDTDAFPYRFDILLAGKFFRFAELLKHYKGKWAGQTIRLQPYQKFRLGSVFGWVHRETGLRRFRTSYHEIPRKNGKTLEAAIVLLYLAFYDGESGGEGYCIATKRDQAKLVFNDAKRLVLSSWLATRIQVHVGNLNREANYSKVEPLGADHDSTDGLNPNVYVADELHAYKDRALLDVMETATGAREQPHAFQITTAGNDLVSPCGDQHVYAVSILEGTVEDETFFAFIASADDGDDWTDEGTWRKANPNWNVSVNPDDMRSLAKKAKHIPLAAAQFKQKRLNLWGNADAPCLSVEGWRAGQSAWSAADLVGESCYIGIDLASKLDLCSATAVFPPTATRKTWRWLQKIWTPGETLADRAHRDRAPYETWVDKGWLTATPGKSIDHEVVRQQVLAWRDLFTILQIGFDPWHADTPIKSLKSMDGFPDEQVIEVPQTYQHMSAACLRVQAEILQGGIDAGGCPVTAWSVGNAVAQFDGKDNMQFIKKKSRGRIDPVVSGTVAMSLAIRQEDEGDKEYFKVLNVRAS